jgi:hypothetical protein
MPGYGRAYLAALPSTRCIESDAGTLLFWSYARALLPILSKFRSRRPPPDNLAPSGPRYSSPRAHDFSSPEATRPGTKRIGRSPHGRNRANFGAFAWVREASSTLLVEARSTLPISSTDGLAMPVAGRNAFACPSRIAGLCSPHNEPKEENAFRLFGQEGGDCNEIRKSAHIRARHRNRAGWCIRAGREPLPPLSCGKFYHCAPGSFESERSFAGYLHLPNHRRSDYQPDQQCPGHRVFKRDGQNGGNAEIFAIFKPANLTDNDSARGRFP